MTRSLVTTHVLDAGTGRPAVGVAVRLEARNPDGWSAVAGGTTDDDGRIGELGPAELAPGVYRVSFDTGGYFAATGRTSFYPEVAVSFTVEDGAGHLHVPLLLSPYAYSTYRGS